MAEEYIVPENLYYTKEHEWLKIEGNTAIMGITDYAQKSLHEIVFVDLPNVGRKVKQMESIGTVESVKAVSEIYTPISGQIIEVNTELSESPELINQDPYGEGWIAKIQPEKLNEEIKNLLTPQKYREYLKTLEET
ncbi:glycine cleavage system protein GcvH [Candidatus Bathyarchaeota archaeon]|nr:MAG: glycine cleavage system protein GcvH [Candidatus Bathyarchaeota archaeon]